MKRQNEICLKLFWQDGSVHQRTSCRPIEKVLQTTTGVAFILLTCFVASICISSGWIDSSIFPGFPYSEKISQEFPLRCTNQTHTCPRDYPTSYNPTNPNRPSKHECPSHFKWIYEDLKPWRETGITKEMLEQANSKAKFFRLVILDGKAYVKKYRQSFQTRDKFTLWGILQLMRLYPGKVPDLELNFNCGDTPVGAPPNSVPPPLFSYCADDERKDIVFPDWSFWGWAEINIKPWNQLLKDIIVGNNRTKWIDREPYAYWRGNPNVGRKDIMQCNASEENDWKTHLYTQDWKREIKQGFNQSNLAEQCTHRYKIYIEGRGWSVSTKYILACNSMTLFVMPRYYDFFTRGMVPLQHYWPIIRDNSKCASLKFAVEWGNNHTDMAQKIGNSASNFIQEDLKMDYVYDYMLHLLNEYAKLLRFKPTIPPGAVELCSERMACSANGLWRKFMEDSMVKSPSDFSPCSIPPPYDPSTLRDFLEKKANLTRQVQIWQHEQLQSENRTY